MLMAIVAGIALFVVWRLLTAIKESLTLFEDKLHVIEERLRQKESIKYITPPPQPVAAPISSVSPIQQQGNGPADIQPLLQTASPQADHSLSIPASAIISGPLRAEARRDAVPVQATALQRSKQVAGNPIARITLLVLLVGIAFLFRRYAHIDSVPVVWRLLGAVCVGIMMLVDGWRLSLTRPQYGDLMTASGVGVLYMTVYAAAQWYPLLAPMTAFILLSSVVMLAGILAWFQHSQPVALFGMLAGFAAPLFLPSIASDNALLFYDYALLNVAILAFAWFTAWRDLPVISFVLTTLLGIWWGWDSYEEVYRLTSVACLAYFFMFYLLATLLVFYLQPIVLTRTRRMMVNAFVCALPAIGFAMQVNLMMSVPYALAISAWSLCLVYTALGSLVSMTYFSALKALARPFVVLAVIFGIIALPLSCSDFWLAAGLAFESAVIIWLGKRHEEILIRLFGGLMLLLSLFLFFDNTMSLVPTQFFFSDYYFCAALVFMSSIMGAYGFYSVASDEAASSITFYQDARSVEQLLAKLYFIVGVIGWYSLSINQITLYLAPTDTVVAILCLMTLTSAVSWLFSELLHWPWLRYIAMLLLPAVISLSFDENSILPLSLGCLLIWTVMLYRHDRTPDWYLFLCHLFSLLFVAVFASLQLSTLVAALPDSDIWTYVVCGCVPASLLYLSCFKSKWLSWPVASHPSVYQQYGAGIIACYLAVWLIASNGWSGEMHQYLYVPFFNPLDLAIIFVFGAMVIWSRLFNDWLVSIFNRNATELILGSFCMIALVWFNAVLFRSVHQWMNVPYDYINLRNSMVVQTYCSMLWTVVALAATFAAVQLRVRTLWFIGFALLVMVAAKVFMVDLHNATLLNQGMALAGLGALVLVNHYLLPLPPKR